MRETSWARWPSENDFSWGFHAPFSLGTRSSSRRVVGSSTSSSARNDWEMPREGSTLVAFGVLMGASRTMGWTRWALQGRSRARIAPRRLRCALRIRAPTARQDPAERPHSVPAVFGYLPATACPVQGGTLLDPAAPPAVPERLADPRQVLERVFGYREFRPGQREVIEAVLAGRDCIALMPTGSGKSLTFQIPARILP